MVSTRTLGYQVNCLIDPVIPSVIFGGIFGAFDVFQGARLDPRAFGEFCCRVVRKPSSVYSVFSTLENCLL
jgi:hypothetical protein